MYTCSLTEGRCALDLRPIAPRPPGATNSDLRSGHPLLGQDLRSGRLAPQGRRLMDLRRPRASPPGAGPSGPACGIMDLRQPRASPPGVIYRLDITQYFTDLT
jgi:hypothetical protein